MFSHLLCSHERIIACCTNATSFAASSEGSRRTPSLTEHKNSFASMTLVSSYPRFKPHAGLNASWDGCIGPLNRVLYPSSAGFGELPQLWHDRNQHTQRAPELSLLHRSDQRRAYTTYYGHDPSNPCLSHPHRP